MPTGHVSLQAPHSEEASEGPGLVVSFEQRRYDGSDRARSRSTRRRGRRSACKRADVQAGAAADAVESLLELRAEQLGSAVVHEDEMESLRAVQLAYRRGPRNEVGVDRELLPRATSGQEPARKSRGPRTWGTASIPITTTCTGGMLVTSLALPSLVTVQIVPVSATPKLAPVMPMSAVKNFSRDACGRRSPEPRRPAAALRPSHRRGSPVFRSMFMCRMGPTMCDGVSPGELRDPLTQVRLHDL